MYSIEYAVEQYTVEQHAFEHCVVRKLSKESRWTMFREDRFGLDPDVETLPEPLSLMAQLRWNYPETRDQCYELYFRPFLHCYD
jgi:hypothetical protein